MSEGLKGYGAAGETIVSSRIGRIPYTWPSMYLRLPGSVTEMEPLGS